LPQTPQLLASEDSETHAPPQGEVDPPHTHAPELQYFPVGQVAPHAPQFAELLVRSTQLVPHAVSVDVVQTHAPTLHACEEPQAFPHAPQLARSFTGTHTPPQIRPLSQVQTPPAHRSPTRQALPHAPQFNESIVVRAHLPPQTTPPPGH